VKRYTSRKRESGVVQPASGKIVAEDSIERLRTMMAVPTLEGIFQQLANLPIRHGQVRKAYLPAESEPVIFGVHGAVAEHYKVPATVADPRATTLDYKDEPLFVSPK
jgi:hypothetical protein